MDIFAILTILGCEAARCRHITAALEWLCRLDNEAVKGQQTQGLNEHLLAHVQKLATVSVAIRESLSKTISRAIADGNVPVVSRAQGITVTLSSSLG